MNRKVVSAVAGLALAACLCGGVGLLAQRSRVQPGLVERAMPDFTLATLDGRSVTLSELQGRNVHLVFPRLRYDDQSWCQLCHYQYADLAELEKAQQFRKTRNVEVPFVLPYARDVVERWVTMFPKQMADVDKWRESPPAMRDRLLREGGLQAWTRQHTIPDSLRRRSIGLDASRALLAHAGRHDHRPERADRVPA